MSNQRALKVAQEIEAAGRVGGLLNNLSVNELLYVRDYLHQEYLDDLVVQVKAKIEELRAQYTIED